MKPEELARVWIDNKLEESGWLIVNRDEYRPGMPAVAIREFLLKGQHEADYVLMLNGKVAAVLEAKRGEIRLDAPELIAQAEGYTKGKEKVLSASDISEALLCFRNVAALATHGEGTPSTRAAAETEHSDDYAAVADLIVAYEFGISRATIVKDEAGNEQVLVEVTLRNDLATDFADRVDHIKDPSEFTNADKTADIENATPAYAEGTTLVFSVNNVDIKANQVTEEDLPAEAAAGTSLTRRFRIPLSAFLEGTANAERLEFSVRAVPPETTSEAQAAYLKSLF